MILIYVFAAAVIVFSVAAGISDDDFFSGCIAFLVGGVLFLFVLLIVGCVSSGVSKDLEYYEVEYSNPIVDFDGEYLVKIVDDEKEYWCVWVKSDVGLQESRIRCSQSYIVFDDVPRVEKNRCVAFKKQKLYFFASPALVDDYYTIYIPKEG